MHFLLTRRLVGVVVVFAAWAFAISAFAQTGGVTGKCTGEDGQPLAGYTIKVDRQEIKWGAHVKTNKKGEFTYIGLAIGEYKFTLLDPSGKEMFHITRHVGSGDPVDVTFDMAKEKAAAHQEQMANPETAKKLEEQAKEHKQFTSLKETFDQASNLFAQQHYLEAAKMYEQALPMAKDKNQVIIEARMGDSYMRAAGQEQGKDARLQDQQKAIDSYQKALTSNPNDATLHNNLGSVYAEQGNIPDAQKEFQKAADLNPTGASSYYYNLGVVMVNQGKMDDAAVALKKSTDLDPTNGNAFYWLGMALLGKAETKPDGTVVPVPGTIEAFQNYLKLQPNGQWAQAAQASIDQLKASVPTEYKAQKKPKKS